MKRRWLLAVLLLSVVALGTYPSWAQDGYYQCCCDLECCYTYNTFTDPFTFKTVCTSLNKCTMSDILLKDLCESDLTALWTCIDLRLEAMDSPIFDLIRNAIWFFEYASHTGSCTLSEIDCLSTFLRGADYPELNVVRKFRDEVLTKSEKGRKLIGMYYTHGSELITVLEDNPGIKAFAAELLAKTIARLSTVGAGEELLTDDLAADIEVLADELNAVIETPELKTTLKDIKEGVRNRILFNKEN